MPRAGPFAIEVALKFSQNPAPDSDQLDSLRGTREAGKDRLDTREAGKDQLDSLGGTREAPGRQERTILDSLRGTREAPGRQERTLLDSLRGTREAPGTGKDRLDSLRGTREAPGRHQGGRKGPTGHQGGRKGPFEQPGRHQGGEKDKEKDKACATSGLLKAILCYEDAFKGNPVLRERQERTIWTACEAPGRHQGKAPGRQ